MRYLSKYKILDATEGGGKKRRGRSAFAARGGFFPVSILTYILRAGRDDERELKHTHASKKSKGGTRGVTRVLLCSCPIFPPPPPLKTFVLPFPPAGGSEKK